MPILATGKTLVRYPQNIRGFTLLELLIVLVIVSILSAGAALSITSVSSEQKTLRHEAQILMHTFEMLEEESELRFSSLVWIEQKNGWKVLEQQQDHWQTASFITPHAWKNIQVTIASSEKTSVNTLKSLENSAELSAINSNNLIFNRRLRDQHFTLTLRSGHFKQTLYRSAEGRYRLSE